MHIPGLKPYRLRYKLRKRRELNACWHVHTFGPGEHTTKQLVRKSKHAQWVTIYKPNLPSNHDPGTHHAKLPIM